MTMLLLKHETDTAKRFMGRLDLGDIDDGLITPAKLSFDPVTQGELDDALMAIAGPVCRLVATSNVTLSGTPTIDSMLTAPGDALLLGGQTFRTENGPWIVGTPWARPAGYAPSVGQRIWIREGGLYDDTLWMCSDVIAGDGDPEIVFRRIDRRIIVKTISASYTVDRFSGEIYIGVTNVPGGGLTITMPLSADYIGGRVTVIDQGKTASVGSPITIARSGTDSIDGATSVQITGATVSKMLYPDGTNWYTLS